MVPWGPFLPLPVEYLRGPGLPDLAISLNRAGPHRSSGCSWLASRKVVIPPSPHSQRCGNPLHEMSQIHTCMWDGSSHLLLSFGSSTCVQAPMLVINGGEVLPHSTSAALCGMPVPPALQKLQEYRNFCPVILFLQGALPAMLTLKRQSFLF